MSGLLIYNTDTERLNVYSEDDWVVLPTQADVDDSIATAITAIPDPVTDHGSFTGLGDDDHTIYVLADGSRTMGLLDVTNNIDAGSIVVTNIATVGDLYCASGSVAVGLLPAQAQGDLHIRSATSGATVSVNADEGIFENSANAGISVLGGSTSTSALYLGDSSDPGGGRLSYLNTTSALGLWAGGVQRMTVTTGVEVGSPTGGDKGAGTLNATAVYVNGTALVGPGALPGVTNFVAGQATYITAHPTATPTNFDVDAVIGGTFESIGPTGSGATNIFAGMDSIPSTAVAVIMRISNRITASTIATGYASYAYARQTGSTQALGESNIVTRTGLTNRSGSSETDASVTEFTVAVDSSQRFDMAYFNDGGATSFVSMAVVGWIDAL